MDRVRRLVAENAPTLLCPSSFLSQLTRLIALTVTLWRVQFLATLRRQTDLRGPLVASNGGTKALMAKPLSFGCSGRDQVLCNASRNAVVSRSNSATMFCSLRFSARRNASRLIVRPSDLPSLCSCERDFTFAHIELIAAPLFLL
jgi:hypothetical protein